MNKILRILTVGLIFFTNIFLVSCKEKVNKIVLDKKNPIEFVFNVSKDSLYEVLTNDIILKNLPLMTIKNRRIIPSEILKSFLCIENNQDIFLEPGIHLKSKTYKNIEGEFFNYLVSFYLHLESVDQSHTKVSIKTMEPKIIVGNDLLPSPPHFVRNNKIMVVEPSTIEEYEILLEIGKLVGEKEMPLLILPNEKSKIEIVKY